MPEQPPDQPGSLPSSGARRFYDAVLNGGNPLQSQQEQKARSNVGRKLDGYALLQDVASGSFEPVNRSDDADGKVNPRRSA